VAYSFQRGMLQSDPNGPQWLMLEPLMGYSDTHDVTEEIAGGAYAGDPAALIENASAEELLAVCEKVKASVVADDAAGTVTFNLALPWGPFLATIAQTWGYVLDMDWAIANGAWDGTCETWQNHYAPGAENDPLTDKINGTGPYMLDHWTPGEEYVLVANPNYWRTEPIWEGGPSGVAQIQTVIVRIVSEWGTRFAALQAGDAAWAAVNPEDETQIDPLVGEFCDWQTFECTPNEANPNGTLRKWDVLPSTSRTDVFLNFNVATDAQGNNAYIGSGQLDGNGVPADFFSDIHVRRAFNYCFDYDTYNSEVLNGKGVRNNGPIIRDMLGYNEDGAYYPFDLELCEAELAEAWDGVLARGTGFRITVALQHRQYHPPDGIGRNAAVRPGELLTRNYQVDILGLPWPTMLRAVPRQPAAGHYERLDRGHPRPAQLGAALHDRYLRRPPDLPEDLIAQFSELVTAGALASDPAEREQIYFDLQELHHNEAIQITLSQSSGFRFEQRWSRTGSSELASLVLTSTPTTWSRTDLSLRGS
jgi:peptide/nickel transport system substrate-binding protein